jgi:hypothetical protein
LQEAGVKETASFEDFEAEPGSGTEGRATASGADHEIPPRKKENE